MKLWWSFSLFWFSSSLLCSFEGYLDYRLVFPYVIAWFQLVDCAPLFPHTLFSFVRRFLVFSGFSIIFSVIFVLFLLHKNGFLVPSLCIFPHSILFFEQVIIRVCFELRMDDVLMFIWVYVCSYLNLDCDL